MDNVQKPTSQKNANRNNMKVSLQNGAVVSGRSSNSMSHSGSKVVSNIVDQAFRVKEEPILLDLAVYDEYGNRTVPIYRRSVRLKFGDRNEPELFKEQPTTSSQTFDYHATTDLADLMPAPESWKPNLLDDDVITTVMDKLQTSYPNTLFINPCLTQCILFAKVKHVPLFLDPLAAKKYASIFFVLNDSHRPGNRSHHWSLLMYSRQLDRLYHYDSMKNTNYRVAYELAQKLCDYLNVWAITDVNCEQQGNSTDCGYFVIDYMMKLLYMMRNETHIPLSQINRLPSSIEQTKNFVANVYMRTKMKNQ